MKAIITRNDQTAVLELPTSRMELAGSLSRIGVRTPAYIIPCSDEEEDYIKVKLFGESDFENELTALVTPKDSLGMKPCVPIPPRCRRKFRCRKTKNLSR